MKDGIESIEGGKSDPIAQMLERYAPEADTFEVVLPYGEKLKFRALKSYSDLKAFERKAIGWYQSLPRPGSKEEAAHFFKGHLPQDAAGAVAAYTISELSVEPRIEQLDALKMLKAPWLIEFLVKQIDLANRSIGSLVEKRLLDEAKNAFGATDGGEPSSPSPETPSENTPTP